MSVPSEQRQNPTVYSVVNNQSFSFLDIPSFQIDNRSSSALSSTSQISAVSTDKGQAPNEAYFALVSRAIQVCLAGMVVLALTVQVIGHGPILRIAEILGFMLIFLGSFLISLVVYLWWSSWTRGVIGLDSYRTLKVYCICCLSEFVATLSNYVVDLGPLEHSPIDVAFYGVLTLLLFSLFSSVIHERGVAAMFNHETMFFVSLTITLHFIMSCLFENILPSFIYSQIVYSSCFLALSICLLLAKYHSFFSMATIGQFVHTSIHGQKNLLPPTYSGRRFSNVSVLSNMSSVHPRNSLTSQSSFSYSIPSGHNFDLDTLNEAHGLLGDILFQESHLSQKGKESLKHIQEMLAPRVTRTAPYATRSRIGSNVSEDESDASSSIGVNPHLYGYRTSKIHRKSHRISSSQFTTTTTATGLPNVDQDPAERKRSLAPRDVRTRLSVAEGRPSVHQMHLARRERLGSHPSPLARQYKNSTPISPTSDISDIDETRVRSSTYSSGQHSDNESRQPVLGLKRVESEPTDSLKPVAKNEEVKRRADSLPRQFIISNMTVEPEVDDVITIPEETLTEAASSETELEVSTPHALQPPKINLSHSLHQLNVSLLNHYVVPSNSYSIEEYQQTKISLFDQVVEWDFPIFELEKVAGDHILSQMAYCLFLEAGLIETFRIPQREFINYFRAMEANYGTNAYHNKTHAADVLHATSFLLFEQIPEFSFEMSRSAERVWIGHQRGPSGGNIASAFSILEVFACYMAAAMHDFDHPGRTNAFLVATKNPLAILYNDKSVLENHHAAASWDLLVSIPGNNFLLDLDDAELKRFRFLLVECILATDLKLHFNIVREFKEKIEDGQAIDWSDDVDRLQVMKMIIKMADINTPTKSYQLHRSWTVRITEEFFQQHDDEIRLGLPQTIFMNRNEKEKLPAIQVSFIQNLVSPLFHASAAAGVIPGIIESESPGLVDKKNEESIDLSDTEFGSDHALDEDDVSIPDEAPLPKIRKVISIILTNLEMNFQAWHDELPHEEDSLQDSEETKEFEESDEIISQQSTKDPA